MAKKQVTIVVTGDEEINRSLANLSSSKAKKLIRSASRKALRPVHKKAKQNAPRRTGNLSQNIKLRSMKRSRSRIGSRVTSGGVTNKGTQTDYTGKTFYGAFLEYGTENIAARNFMRTAADSEQETALRIYKAELGKAIEELVK